MQRMLSMRELKAQDLHGLTPDAVTALAAQMLEHIEQQARQLDIKYQQIQRQARDIAWRDAKLEKVSFELVRLKRWKFGAKTEAMNAEQRQMFQDTLLEAQLAELRAALPEDTACPTPDCGQPMARVGEDVSERLDIVPAEFFVRLHIYGKWACRCCQRQGIERLVQEPAQPQIIDRGIRASGLVAHTLTSRFVDHLPYYRQEAINARSGMHTPRSTLAAWAGMAGAALEPLYEAHKRSWQEVRQDNSGTLLPSSHHGLVGGAALRCEVVQWARVSFGSGQRRSRHGPSAKRDRSHHLPLRARHMELG
ncbi:MAG: IS66 family transposase zinc-finger binding domain-containing protein [Rubrivivax sp.]|nr:IS66 family transposase zinc-finger binding domain-containing protein [Rubrivivax sp.]